MLTNVGVLGEDGALVRLFLGGEPTPEPGPGTGYLVKLVVGESLSSASKPTRGLTM